LFITQGYHPGLMDCALSGLGAITFWLGGEWVMAIGFSCANVPGCRPVGDCALSGLGLIVFDLTQGYHPGLMDCALSGLGLIVFDLTQGYHPVLMDCALSGLGSQ
jgi:hypothetical protein